MDTIDDLKERILSVQSEEAYINLLLSEFIGNILATYTNCNLQLKKEVLWKLMIELLEAFSLPESTTYLLFSNTF